MANKVYGGLWLENLVNQDKYFDLQMKLFEKGLIQGCQIRVAHPSFTPNISIDSIPQTLSVLPDNLWLFIHFGSENVGVDLGETFDECDVFKERGKGKTWKEWNAESINWGFQIAQHTSTVGSICEGTIHPGYGKDENDSASRNLITESLSVLDPPNTICFENTVPLPRKNLNIWGFGSTPTDMAKLLEKFPDRECLIDFTHLYVTCNQLNGIYPRLKWQKELWQLTKHFLCLPHSNVCHFSGAPNTLEDNHDYIDAPVVPAFYHAISEMKTVCLEIRFDPDNFNETAAKIERFRKNYQIY